MAKPTKLHTLVVVDTQEIREVVGHPAKPGNHFEELAVGKTRRMLFVRGPISKRLFLLECPEELLEEINGRYTAPKRNLFRKGRLEIVK